MVLVNLVFVLKNIIRCVVRMERLMGIYVKCSVKMCNLITMVNVGNNVIVLLILIFLFVVRIIRLIGISVS